MKIAICIPCHASAHAWFVQSLAQMISRTLAQGAGGAAPQLNTSVLLSSEVAKSRNQFVRNAMTMGADRLLWLDSDHIFPDWTLLRLLGIDLPVIGITQPTRTAKPLPTAFQADGSRVYSTPELVKDKAVERVAFIGLGICLMDMKIIPALAAQASREGRSSIFPLFDRTMTEDPDKSDGEDAFFCRRLQAADIPVHVDHLLSWETSHIAHIPVTMADALAARETAGQ